MQSVKRTASEFEQAWYWPMLAGLLAIVLRLALLPLVPIPVPAEHDEFSYLLGGDTFASGRVTNPPHPMWVHFETFHVNMQPTYCSKYPPAQALFLAFGQRLFGNPWFGVCFSMGVMISAICWMLLGWVLPKYALFTTLLTIFGWGVSGTWINSYWGGAVAAAGGALAIGAVPRLIRQCSVMPALLGSVGLVILANSRPFEGLLAAGAAAAVLAWRRRQRKRRLRSLVTVRVVVPFLSVMAPAAAAMGYYNYRTTGNALLLPYTVNERTYAASPFFYVLPPIPTPVYRHENLRRLWVDWVLPFYKAARARPEDTIEHSALIAARFYLFTPFGLVVLAGLLLAWNPETRSALVIVAAPMIGLALAIGTLPHYLAPAFGAFLIIGALGLQRIGQWRSAAPMVMGGVLGLSLGWCALMIRKDARLARQTPAGIATRPLLIDRLQRMGGRHLVIVRYSPVHDVHSEWVYNRARIDASDIVWAQDMGTGDNRELLNYYRGRKVWLLQPDVDPLALTSYPQPPS